MSQGTTRMVTRDEVARYHGRQVTVVAMSGRRHQGTLFDCFHRGEFMLVTHGGLDTTYFDYIEVLSITESF